MPKGASQHRGAETATPQYDAPEVIAGRTATKASDVYSFGVVLWESIHLQRPFQGDPLFPIP